MEVYRRKRVGIILVGVALLIGVTLIGLFAGFIRGWLIVQLIILAVVVVLWMRSKIRIAGPSRFEEVQAMRKSEERSTEYWDSLVGALRATRRNRSYFEKRLRQRISAVRSDKPIGLDVLEGKLTIAKIESILDLIEADRNEGE